MVAISTSDRVRVGVLGLGAVAQAVHLPLLDRLGDRFEVSAIADLSAGLVASIGERYRVAPSRRATSLEGLLALPGLDALLVLSSGSHGDAVLRGLELGLPVFSEKPLAWTLAEVDAIAARLDGRHGAALQVGYMKLYDPAVVAALDVAADVARVGLLRAIEVTVLHPSADRQLAHARLLPPPADVPAATLERIREEGDRLRRTALGPAAPALGPLYSDVILGSIVHDLALVRALAGDPVGIDGVDVWPPDRWPSSVGITGRLPGDARLAIRWHYLPDHPAYREEVRVVTERASIELEFPSPYLLHAATDLRVGELAGPARQDTRRRSVAEAFEEELLGFHALVTSGAPPRAGLAEGRAHIVTAQRIAACRARALGIGIETEAEA
jgi:myo-inositol 2-dehydrogenase / D-chiro-inositol 1-dehydrogenase